MFRLGHAVASALLVAAATGTAQALPLPAGLPPELLHLVGGAAPPGLAADLCAAATPVPDAAALCGTLAAAVAAPPSPEPPRPARWRAEGEADLRFLSLSRLGLEGGLEAREMAVEGVGVTADGARATFAAAGPGGGLFVATVESSARGSFGDALAAGGARPEGLEVRVDAASLRAEAAGQPLRILLRATLVPAQPLPPQDEAKALAALAAGARLTLPLALQAPPGIAMAYVLHAPDGLAFAEAPEGALRDGGRALALRLDNAEGEADLVREVRVTLRDPAARAPEAEDLRGHVRVALGETTADGLPVALEVDVALRALDLDARLPGALPEGIRLPLVDADGLRGLVAAGAVPERDLLAVQAALVEAVRRDLDAALPGAIVSGDILRDSLAADAPPGSPVRLHLRAFAWQPVPAEEAALARLALDLGARLALDVPLPAVPLTGVTFALQPPPGLELLRQDADALGPEGGVARVVVRRPDAPRAEATDARVAVEVDVAGLEVEPSRLLSGGDPHVVLRVKATALLRAVEVPPELRATLDPRVDLTHLSADGLRLLRARGHLDDAALARVEREVLDAAREGLRGALGPDVQVEGGIVAQTLRQGPGPVVVEVRASARQPVHASPATASLGLHTQTLTFTLPRLEGLDTHYVLVLPEGVEIGEVRAQGGDVERARVGGRDALLLRPEEDAMTASAVATVTHAWALANHGPLLVAVLAGLALVAEVPLAWLLLRRGRRAGSRGPLRAEPLQQVLPQHRKDQEAQGDADADDLGHLEEAVVAEIGRAAPAEVVRRLDAHELEAHEAHRGVRQLLQGGEPVHEARHVGRADAQEQDGHHARHDDEQELVRHGDGHEHLVERERDVRQLHRHDDAPEAADAEAREEAALDVLLVRLAEEEVVHGEVEEVGAADDLQDGVRDDERDAEDGDGAEDVRARQAVEEGLPALLHRQLADHGGQHGRVVEREDALEQDEREEDRHVRGLEGVSEQRHAVRPQPGRSA